MKKWATILLVFFLLVFNKDVLPLWAQNSDECANKTGQEKINCLEEVLNRLSGKSKTLGQEIDKRKTQIRLTGAQIAKTEQDITALAEKIGRLEVSLDQLAIIVKKRIAATYKKGEVDPITMFFSSSKFSDLVARYKYLRVIQQHDKKLLYAMETTRTNYDEQKQAVEALKEKLESQKATLAKQQKEMEFLLAETKNQEKTYQDLLARALAEQAAVQTVISQAVADLKAGKGESVLKGSTIGLIGNSGYPDCSTGTHLHFTILKDGIAQNPAEYLKSTALSWDNPDPQLNFTGSWDWPISNPRITQSYGMTYYVRVLGYYGGNPHDGIDMTSTDSNLIKAPADGKIIRGMTTCDSSRFPGVSTLKFMAIGHADNIITIYLHNQ